MCVHGGVRHEAELDTIPFLVPTLIAHDDAEFSSRRPLTRSAKSDLRRHEIFPCLFPSIQAHSATVFIATTSYKSQGVEPSPEARPPHFPFVIMFLPFPNGATMARGREVFVYLRNGRAGKHRWFTAPPYLQTGPGAAHLVFLFIPFFIDSGLGRENQLLMRCVDEGGSCLRFRRLAPCRSS